MFEKIYNNETAEELYKKGYRQVSRRFKIIARVDVDTIDMLKVINKSLADEVIKKQKFITYSFKIFRRLL